LLEDNTLPVERPGIPPTTVTMKPDNDVFDFAKKALDDPELSI